MAVTKVGVLGGGQLGRMLALQGASLGYEIHVFSENADDPAAQVTRFWHQGLIGQSSENSAELARFFKSVDVVTFESEFIAPEPLRAAIQTTQTPIRPSLEIMAQLRERGSQKKLLAQHKVATTLTLTAPTAEDLRKFFVTCKTGVVAKKRLFGYDGYGTFMLHTEAELRRFLENSQNDLQQFIFEPIVKFKRELAISVARDIAGNIVFLPLVEWRARDKKCHWVKGPVKHRGLDTLKRSLRKFLTQIEYCGFITFELFDLGRNLIVNEVAPRVHNSAHYSLNGLSRDQFQLHLLAITTRDLKLDPKPLTGGFAMINLTGTNESIPHLAQNSNCFLHWYNKKQNRPGRKMGHINTLGKTADEALKLALREEKRFKL